MLVIIIKITIIASCYLFILTKIQAIQPLGPFHVIQYVIKIKDIHSKNNKVYELNNSLNSFI